ncbi:MAG: hypothetical protein ACXWL5_04950, partial [Candidatus Chromulinivorax sp.]
MKKYDKQLVVFLYIFFISASIYPMSEKLVKTVMTGVSSTLAKNSFGLLTTQENLIDSAAQVAGVGAFLYAPLYLANTSEDIHIKVNNQAHEYIRNEKKKIYTSLQKLMQNSDTIAKVNTIENPDFNILLQAHWRLQRFNWPKRFNWPDRKKDHFLNSEGAFWTPRMLMSAGMLASLASNPQVA